MSSRTVAFLALVWAAVAFLQHQIHFNDKDGMKAVRRLDGAIAVLRADNRRIEAGNGELRAQLREIEDAPDIVAERLARKWFFMIKPDEVYVEPSPAK